MITDTDMLKLVHRQITKTAVNKKQNKQKVGKTKTSKKWSTNDNWRESIESSMSMTRTSAHGWEKSKFKHSTRYREKGITLYCMQEKGKSTYAYGQEHLSAHVFICDFIQVIIFFIFF